MRATCHVHAAPYERARCPCAGGANGTAGTARAAGRRKGRLSLRGLTAAANVRARPGPHRIASQHAALCHVRVGSSTGPQQAGHCAEQMRAGQGWMSHGAEQMRAGQGWMSHCAEPLNLGNSCRAVRSLVCRWQRGNGRGGPCAGSSVRSALASCVEAISAAGLALQPGYRAVRDTARYNSSTVPPPGTTPRTTWSAAYTSERGRCACPRRRGRGAPSSSADAGGVRPVLHLRSGWHALATHGAQPQAAALRPTPQLRRDRPGA